MIEHCRFSIYQIFVLATDAQSVIGFNIFCGEQIVEDCDPSASFNRTALAEQFMQSQSIDDVPDHVDPLIDDEDEDLDSAV